MKKEVILAITIGFALGLVITFGIWTANRSLKGLPGSTQATPVSVAATPSTTSDQSQSVSLSLSSPADEALVDTNKIEVSGTTQANATVVVLSEDDQQIVTADKEGKFLVKVGLIGGFNVIRVVVYDNEGHSTQQSVTVTYSTAKIWARKHYF